jgi:hypothetical protein
MDSNDNSKEEEKSGSGVVSGDVIRRSVTPNDNASQHFDDLFLEKRE